MEHYFWQEVLKNKTLGVVLLSAAVAQGIKIVLGIIKERKFNFYWLLGTGGMPSAHTSMVVAFSVCMGKEFGFSSAFFTFSVIFALTTMFDAQTWRRSIGAQARILNVIMDDIYQKKTVSEDKLRELVGHTPKEVFAGALIGLIISSLFY